MNFIKNNLANVLTLGNLFSGCVGAIHLITGDYAVTALCLIFSLVLDFFDGFVARALKANSSLGVQLDSLADMVSFGLLPGLTMFKALEPFGNILAGIHFPFEIKYIGLIITLFSCLRLAIFNIDEEQKYYFKGLNTPSNTVLVFGLYYADQEHQSFGFLFGNAGILILLTFILSWLLISPVKMIAMKFKSMKLKDNYPKLVLVIGALIIVAIFRVAGIPMVVIYYMLVSVIFRKQLTS
ncbi:MULTISPECIES: CDP-alcohol phosphatidyltransferase family protein [Chryseobacterium]|uniref:CDP-diacylglycerol--serine O-phosphatidyltransferase n=1 Tax=Chryseobacterium camelliae TaxID=1265445 RepID=A0ABU0TJY0_9FLAO|nr:MULTISPECIES: CDP-alcohol phosphatidyltransferase family protein [Chryseobacterium]MDT3408788.1 CDP-diacylglycerol--serine O-phosphatidyltransferase [Pseudacidovorax intermedius]MDQ1097357.1 CDP-diacylglycerol--serine O-phosphatidyltransferase [Chryseobacterium camelliae]MDQ1101288.1 CDP-diacylglycerol--serine O-phosphatidyltransferase [Chryseobacterium sp. SORGH_AS_1048]MDR6084733.1 CDP-diacylglycerol--serine O-phosphatidyltransferase [Chryseobacterium sp. SORGH_AS_0909]MDR6133006.1 CDP-di